MNNSISLFAAGKIREYMNRYGIKQREMATRAKVSQATVSRALKGKALRRGAARNKLFSFIGINESSLNNARERVMTAFDEIWDHSEVHAEAIARVIDTLGEFSSPHKTAGDK